ncbi:MAG TPA: PRC-barrel domain-containing protein [Gaiellaceae bacterium]
MVLSVTLPLPLDEPGEQLPRGPAVRLRAVPRALRIRRPLPGTDEGHPWLLELEFDVAVPDPEGILADSHGFLVDTTDGRELGVVDEVEVGPDGAVTALVVAGGWFGRRRTRIQVEEIEAILPAERRIIVRG